METMRLERESDRVQEAELEGRVRGKNDGKDNIEYIIKFERVKRRIKKEKNLLIF